MKYFLDCEFIEDGRTIDLISIALVDNSRSLYLQNSECNFTKANDWVWRNVFPYLDHFNMSGSRICYPKHETYDSGLGHRTLTKCGEGCPWAKRSEILQSVINFCDEEKYGEPEIWGYYADYDWVAFCQLFGSMIDLPKGYPMYCRDLKQSADAVGFRIPETNTPHHALADALEIRDRFKLLFESQKQG